MYRACPNCGTEMEPIETGAEGLPFEQLGLCPECYLVVWDDAAGAHFRQGVPVKVGSEFRERSIN